MHINELVQAIHANAVNHGFWDPAPSFGELVALCHSELSEALEEFRKGRRPNEEYLSVFVDATDPAKPEGIPSELADTVIRIMDMCAYYGIDLEAAILEKHEYNKTRPYKHGGKVI